MKNCFQKLVSTDVNNYGLTIIRVVLGVVIGAHGAQKLFGMFGWYGFEGTMGAFTGGMGLPYIVALLVVLGESLGAYALIAWFISRFMAFGIFVIVGGAMFMAHLSNGFFIDWMATGAGNGIEYHVLVLAMALVIMMQGGWAFAFDSVLKKCCKKK